MTRTRHPGYRAAIFDELAIIITEARDLTCEDDPARIDEALATISQAVHTLKRTTSAPLEACARITHNNGQLVPRYSDERKQLDQHDILT